MPRARRLALALTTASLAIPAGAIAQGAGGAGDSQYTDPFAGSGSSSSKSGGGSDSNSNGSNGSSNSGSQSGGDNGLSQNPGLSGNGSSSSSSSTSTSGTSATSSNGLPNTGTDLRLMFLAGLTLVLAGTGLRMRTADEEF